MPTSHVARQGSKSKSQKSKKMALLELLDCIRMYPEKTSAHKMKHHMVYSDVLGDDELMSIVDVIK